MRSSPSAPQLVQSLARLCDRHPVARKLVVSPTLSAGRELLRRLALSGRGWIGFEVITPRPLALRLAGPAMERADAGLLDAFETRALLDEAMDHAIAADGAPFGDLADGVGFRERAHGAIEALRLAPVSPRELERARLSDGAKRRFLARMLLKYEQLLGARRRMDTADLLRTAVAALEEAGAALPDSLDADVVVLMPGLGMRGLTGRLLGALTSRGAKVLETDPVAGLEVPKGTLWRPAKSFTRASYLHAPLEEGAEDPGENGARSADRSFEVELFRAASINDELREVIRRAMARGLRWDDVEIVTPDPAAYGSAMHALGVRLGVPVTYAVGLPIERTRTGRVVRAYLDWIAEGFQASPIRRLLEAGDLRPPRSRGDHSPAVLARRFRSLRIGWGRLRYRTQIREALEGLDRIVPGLWETEEQARRRRERARAELQALRSILFPALRATPSVPDHAKSIGGEIGTGTRVSAAELARGLRAFLKRVPRGRGPDRSAREEVDRVLERVEATLVRRTSFLAAITELRRHLDVRVRASVPGDRGEDAMAPWASEGGHVHLTDLRHGGYTGRKAVFLVGFDADRTLAYGGQDPVLLDRDRRILSQDLPTSLELMRESDFETAALFARLRGRVTLSYSAWEASAARVVAPSPVLLLALRLARRDASLSFEHLGKALGRVVCPTPVGTRRGLDGDDAWMSVLTDGAGLRTGTELIGSAFPRIAAGLDARSARLGPPGPHHGVVAPRPDAFDPRRNPALVVSASRLQELGKCPLSYLHGAVLGIHAPDDPELDPDRWLDALQSGSLLHQVFDEALRATKNGVVAADEAFETLTLDALSRGIERMRAQVPSPGEGAVQRQAASLRNDVRSFVRMIRQRGASWVALELRFGLAGDEPASIDVDGGVIRLRGAIDRVDEDLSGLTVIDYKTGVPRDFGKTGTFHGGRRLQHALYAVVAEERLRSRVVSGQFHFPTMRGQNEVHSFDRLRMVGVHGLLSIMLDGVAAGSFVPTNDANDCKYCDYAAVCRAQESGYGRVSSPLAEWAEEHLNAALWPAFEHLKRARTFES